MAVDVSIIIVNWNARDYLMRAVESVLATCQRHTFQVIVVDNASTDGSPDAIAVRYPEVELIRNPENVGFARGNNLGLTKATGRYIALVNSDAEALPGCLDRMVEVMDANPGLGMLGPRVLNTDGSVQHSHWNFPSVRRTLARALALDTLWRKFHIHRRELKNIPDRGPGIRPESRTPKYPVDVLSGCFMMLRRKALDQVGFFDASFYMYGEDMDLCRRFRDAGWRICLDPGARAIHAGGASSAASPVRFFLELQRANFHYWVKHHGKAGGMFFLTVTFIHHLLRLIPGIIIYLIVPPLRSTSSYKIKRSTACMKWIFHHPGSGAASS